MTRESINVTGVLVQQLSKSKAARVYVSQPQAVASLIERAAKSVALVTH
jgi:hypothetical protein